jgi:hypothetical protein
MFVFFCNQKDEFANNVFEGGSKSGYSAVVGIRMKLGKETLRLLGIFQSKGFVTQQLIFFEINDRCYDDSFPSNVSP